MRPIFRKTTPNKKSRNILVTALCLAYSDELCASKRSSSPHFVIPFAPDISLPYCQHFCSVSAPQQKILFFRCLHDCFPPPQPAHCHCSVNHFAMTRILLSLAALSIYPLFCAGSATPGLQWDPDTIRSCVEWYDNDEGKSCEYVRSYFGITPEQFNAWNPSVGVDCKRWDPTQSYCIVTQEKLDNTPKSTTTSKLVVSTTTTSTLGASPPAWTALGCFFDNYTLPVLEKRISGTGGDLALTISKCQNACYLANLKYAGVKAGNECWCSTYVGGELAKNETDCNLPCSGDKKSICGGKERINVFKPLTYVPQKPASTQSTSVVSKPSGMSKGSAVNNSPVDSGAKKNLVF